jgi:hypothetical protein
MAGFIARWLISIVRRERHLPPYSPAP